MPHLILLGATGRTGRLAVDYALAEGHTLTALVREPAKLEARPGLTLVTGTPEREADIEHAFAVAVPADGVVIALNNVRTSDMPWARQISPPRFMADAVRYTTDAMNRHGVERIAVISAFGVGDSLTVMPSYLRWLIKHTNLGKTYADHNPRRRRDPHHADRLDIGARGRSVQQRPAQDFTHHRGGSGWQTRLAGQPPRGGPVCRGRRSGGRLGRSGTDHLGEIARLGRTSKQLWHAGCAVVQFASRRTARSLVSNASGSSAKPVWSPGNIVGSMPSATVSAVEVRSQS